MPNVRISDLPPASLPLVGDELVELTQNGLSVQTTVDVAGGSTAFPIIALDGDQIQFGTGTDFTLEFDGTNLVLDRPATIGASPKFRLVGHHTGVGPQFHMVQEAAAGNNVGIGWLHTVADVGMMALGDSAGNLSFVTSTGDGNISAGESLLILQPNSGVQLNGDAGALRLTTRPEGVNIRPYLFMRQQAAAGADQINDGQFWVRNDANQTPMFTDDTGVSSALNAPGDVTKVGTPVDNQVAIWTGDGTIEGDADFTYKRSGGSNGEFFLNTITGLTPIGSIVSATPGLVAIYGVGVSTNIKAGNVEIWGGYAAGSSPSSIGGDLMLWGGGGGGGASVGGNACLRGGRGDNTPGEARVIGGIPSVDGNGGAVRITAGQAVGTNKIGGSVLIDAGVGIGTANGGLLHIFGGIGGNSSGDGGDVSIRGGQGGSVNGDGGDLRLTGGSSSGAGVDGVVIIDDEFELRFRDAGETAWVSFQHDATDFNTVGVNTTDWNITGITAINAGTVDLDVDNLTATDFNGVALTTGGAATNYLDETGSYSVPVGSGMQVGVAANVTALHRYTTANTPAPAAASSALTRDFLYLDGKEAIDGADAFLRINDNGDFGSGVFIGSRLRLDSANGLDIRDATAARTCTFITSLTNHRINGGSGLTNLEVIGFTGDLALLGGVGLIINSVGSAGNVAFNNDGTTLTCAGASMVDINWTGIQVFTMVNYSFDVDQTVGAGQDNFVLTYDNGTGLISLEASAGGGIAATPTPASGELAVWDSTGATLAGEPELTYTGSNLLIDNGVGGLSLDLRDGDTTGAGATAIMQFTDQVGTVQASIGTAPVSDILLLQSSAGQVSIVAGTGGVAKVTIDALSIQLEEKAAPGSDNAGYGQFWVRNDAPNIPMFTDDDSTDQVIDPSISEINTQNGNYTLVIGDKGKTIHKASGGVGETITIPANASVAFKIGTWVAIDNQGGGVLSIAITSDTLESTDGTTGTQTLSDNGRACIQKLTATTWRYMASDV